MSSGSPIRPAEGLPNIAEDKISRKAVAKRFKKITPKLKKGVDYEAIREAKKKFYGGLPFEPRRQ